MRVYAPVFGVPSNAGSSRVLLSYDIMRRNASVLSGYVKLRISTEFALALADRSPYPSGVKLGVMKQVANTKEVTLEQMRILLGWAARKAQGAA